MFEKIQRQILTAIREQEVLPWVKPWNCNAVPTNLLTGKPYTGGNPILLNFQSGGECQFMGFNQGKSVGARLKRGSKSCQGVVYRPGSKREQRDSSTGEVKEYWARAIVKTFHVFPLSAWDSLGKLEGKINQDSGIDTVLGNSDAATIRDRYQAAQTDLTLSHGSNAASYMPMREHIALPNPNSFTSESAYWATCYHEMAHSSGHETRLKRELTPANMDVASYSKEELVAEITAAYLCSVAMIENTRQNSISYLQHWYKKLEEDGIELLISAASKADAAAKFILGK